jgi:Fe-S cluster biosynthesis and repair protein YggX
MRSLKNDDIGGRLFNSYSPRTSRFQEDAERPDEFELADMYLPNEQDLEYLEHRHRDWIEDAMDMVLDENVEDLLDAWSKEQG